MSGALLEWLAAVVDHNDSIRLIVIINVHVQDGSVRVDDIGLDILRLSVKPFVLQVDLPSTVDKDKAWDRLQAA